VGADGEADVGNRKIQRWVCAPDDALASAEDLRQDILIASLYLKGAEFAALRELAQALQRT
jgi:hypothetical protein